MTAQALGVLENVDSALNLILRLRDNCREDPEGGTLTLSDDDADDLVAISHANRLRDKQPFWTSLRKLLEEAQG